MQLVVVSSFNLALTFNGHIFSLLLVYFSIITLNKGNVGTNHLNNRILLFVCNRKVIYYYYITLPSITITITITFGNFQSITITAKSGYYILQLHITYYPIPDRLSYNSLILHQMAVLLYCNPLHRSIHLESHHIIMKIKT